MAGFDENTTDPVALAAMFESMDKGTSPEAEAVTPEVVVPPVAEVAKTVAQVEKEPDGVATKDGKHIIPYSILANERAKASRAEQMLREAQEQLTALQAIQAGAKNVTSEVVPTTPVVNADDLSDEDMEALKEDFPTTYKGLMAMRAQVARLESKLQPVEESARNAEANRQQTVADQVQEAIDLTPKLGHIMSNDPDAYELAKQFDNALKVNPAWAGKPMSERFAKVVEMVELTKGTITVPGNTQPAQKTAEQIKQEAKAVASASAKAGNTAVPTSLSDFPAGQHVASSEAESVANMTQFQLAQKMANMTPDQMEAYLQNL